MRIEECANNRRLVGGGIPSDGPGDTGAGRPPQWARPTVARRPARIAVASIAAAAVLSFAGAELVGPTAASATSGASVAAKQDQMAQDPAVAMNAQQVHKQFLALPEVQKALAEIEAQQQTAAVAPASVAKAFGKNLLAGLVQAIGRETFSYALQQMGFNSQNQQEVIEALSEIQSSLTEIREQNQQIVEAIEEVHNEVLKANFKRANADVVLYSDNVEDTLRVVQHWISSGVTPHQATVTQTVMDLRAQASAMRGAASDPDSGAVPLLLQAYDRNVSDTEQLWEAVQEYRDQVRVSMAQAVAGIELAMEHWDHPSGEYEASHEVAGQSALNTVDAMFAPGVAASGPSGQPFVQLQGGMALTKFANGGVPVSDGWLWQNIHVNQSTMEPWLQQLASRYRPAKHDGKTLEAFLTERGVPTSYVFTDAWGYRTSYESVGLFKTRRNVFYTPEAKLGRIVGNEYKASHVTFGDRVLAGSQDERCTLPWIGTITILLCFDAQGIACILTPDWPPCPHHPG